MDNARRRLRARSVDLELRQPEARPDPQIPRSVLCERPHLVVWQPVGAREAIDASIARSAEQAASGADPERPVARFEQGADDAAVFGGIERERHFVEREAAGRVTGSDPKESLAGAAPDRAIAILKQHHRRARGARRRSAWPGHTQELARIRREAIHAVACRDPVAPAAILDQVVDRGVREAFTRSEQRELHPVEPRQPLLRPQPQEPARVRQQRRHLIPRQPIARRERANRQPLGANRRTTSNRQRKADAEPKPRARGQRPMHGERMSSTSCRPPSSGRRRRGGGR